MAISTGGSVSTRSNDRNPNRESEACAGMYSKLVGQPVKKPSESEALYLWAQSGASMVRVRHLGPAHCVLCGTCNLGCSNNKSIIIFYSCKLTDDP